MKLGVLSDSHGNLTLLRQAAVKCLEDYNVDVLVHLGDDSEDAEELADLGVDLIWVPGVFEKRYQDKNVENRIVREFAGVPFLITHTAVKDSHDLPDDLDPTELVRDGDVKVVLHGHTHIYRIAVEHNVVFVNPGHLKPDDKRGNPPSFAVLDVNSKRIHAVIVGLDGQILEEKKVFF